MKKSALLFVIALAALPTFGFAGGHKNRHHGYNGYGYQQPAQINQYVYNDDCDDDYGYNNGYRPNVYNNNYYAPPVRQYYAPQPIVVNRNHYYGQPAFQPIFQPAFVPAFQPNFGIIPRNSVNVQFGF